MALARVFMGRTTTERRRLGDQTVLKTHRMTMVGLKREVGPPIAKYIVQ
jgi:hypothetical protein